MSPDATIVAAIAPYYVAFISLRTGAVVARVDTTEPQPADELHCASFVRGTATSPWTLLCAREDGTFVSVVPPSAAALAAAPKADSDAASVLALSFERVRVLEAAEAPPSSDAGVVVGKRVRAMSTLDGSGRAVVTATGMGVLQAYEVLPAARGNGALVMRPSGPETASGGRITSLTCVPVSTA
jgi:hypothetical protein